MPHGRRLLNLIDCALMSLGTAFALVTYSLTADK